MPEFRWGPAGATYSTSPPNFGTPPPDDRVTPRTVKLRSRSRSVLHNQKAVLLAVASLTDALETMASKNYVKPDWTTLTISHAGREVVAEVECRTTTIHRTPGGVWT